LIWVSTQNYSTTAVHRRNADEITDGVETEFTHDLGSVRFHSFDAEVQHLGDHLVVFALSQELNNLPLARGQRQAWTFIFGAAPAHFVSLRQNFR
jgi:hypothetical protein